MADLGEPTSYAVLEKGAAVYSCDQKELGTVQEVRADLQVDIFDGLLVSEGSAIGGGRRFVPGELVEEIFQRGVLLKIDAEAFGQLSDQPGQGQD
ncbi:MAG: PRC-barrel domain containing protein [Solirubrobacterales bacterium]|nr:PRC-barrel domain containing protein [Solirubrobacterales bacterium]